MRFITRLTAIGGAALLASGAAVIAVAAPASAHTIEASATCEALTVDLSNYAASQPGKDAVYHEWDETVHHDAVGTPTITIPNPDYKPAVDAVPGSWEKYTWTAPHGTPSAPPPSAGWHDVGTTSDTKGSTTDTILNTGGKGYFYFLTLQAPVPAQPAVGEPTITVPNPDYVAPSDEVVHHKDLISAAVEPKTNHVSVTIDGASAADEDFSTSYQHVFTFSDKYTAHTWAVDVTAWDNAAYSFHRTGTTTPCSKPVEGVPTITVTGPTCEAGYSLVNYSIPEGLSIAGYTGTGSVKAEDLNLGYGEKTYPVDVAAGYTYDGPAAVSFTLVEPPTDADCAGPKPDDKVDYGQWQTGEYGCGDTTVTESRTVTDTPYKLVGREWVLDTENATTTTEKRDRALTAAEIKALDCPVTVVVVPGAPSGPVSIVNPIPAPQQFVAAGEDMLAHTGSDELGTGIGFGAGILILLGLGTLGVAAIVRRRKATN